MTRHVVFLGIAIAVGIGTPQAHAQVPDLSGPGSGESTLGASPGSDGGTPGQGPGAGGGVIGTGPGPGFPRVPQGITRPGQPFGAPAELGIGPVPSIPVPELPLYGRLEVPTGPEAAGPPGGLTLDQAIARLLQANTDLRAKAMEIPKAQADVITAGLWANPLLFFDSQLIPYGGPFAEEAGPTQYDVNITHPIDWNGKWKRRREVAVLAKNVVEAQYQDAVRLQIDNLYTAWVDVLAARETLRYLRYSNEALGGLVEATRALLDQGAATPADVNRVEVLLDSTSIALVETEETLLDAKRTLATVLYLPPDAATTLEVTGVLRAPDPPIPPVEELIGMALAVRPDLAAYRIGIQRAGANVRLQRANRFEDVFLFYQPYTFQEQRGGTGTHTSWAIGATIPLPVYNRNQGNIQRARHTVVQTKIQLADLERRVITEVQRAERAYAVSLSSVRRLEQDVLPKARQNLEASLDLYKAGEEGQIAFLEAQRNFNEVSRQYRDTLVRHRRVMLQLNTAVGRRLLP
ncbi:TolC family protein [Tautonia sociabilis]|uniref:TolC family protein n=1 Tax=Tautonia sociabilis TaxID=2080755 RepID=A0A432MR87_9BACT|nr:TolC family protein [Tautonia sociabilis]RUL89485.1 TolC family protein [Tautonia sociabilis]